MSDWNFDWTGDGTVLSIRTLNGLFQSIIIDKLESELKECHTVDDISSAFFKTIKKADEMFTEVPLEPLLHATKRRLVILGLQSDAILANLKAAAELL